MAMPSGNDESRWRTLTKLERKGFVHKRPGSPVVWDPTDEDFAIHHLGGALPIGDIIDRLLVSLKSVVSSEPALAWPIVGRLRNISVEDVSRAFGCNPASNDRPGSLSAQFSRLIEDSLPAILARVQVGLADAARLIHTSARSPAKPQLAKMVIQTVTAVLDFILSADADNLFDQMPHLRLQLAADAGRLEAIQDLVRRRTATWSKQITQQHIRGASLVRLLWLIAACALEQATIQPKLCALVRSSTATQSRCTVKSAVSVIGTVFGCITLHRCEERVIGLESDPVTRALAIRALPSKSAMKTRFPPHVQNTAQERQLVERIDRARLDGWSAV
jgi:hypothetical protein